MPTIESRCEKENGKWEVTDKVLRLSIDERDTLVTVTFAMRRCLRCFMAWVNIQVKWKKKRSFKLKCRGMKTDKCFLLLISWIEVDEGVEGEDGRSISWIAEVAGWNLICVAELET